MLCAEERAAPKMGKMLSTVIAIRRFFTKRSSVAAIGSG
jgi:hypothetical protein